jgi:hypothetical protein
VLRPWADSTINPGGEKSVMENLDTPGPTRRSVTVRLPGVVLAAAKLLLAALIIAGLYLGRTSWCRWPWPGCSPSCSTPW